MSRASVLGSQTSAAEVSPCEDVSAAFTYAAAAPVGEFVDNFGHTSQFAGWSQGASDSGHHWNAAGRYIFNGKGALSGTSPFQESGSETLDATSVTSLHNGKFRLELDYSVRSWDGEDYPGAGDANYWYGILPGDTNFGFQIICWDASHGNRVGVTVSNVSNAYTIFSQVGTGGIFSGGGFGTIPLSGTMILTVDAAAGTVRFQLGAIDQTLSGGVGSVIAANRQIFLSKFGSQGSILYVDRVQTYPLGTSLTYDFAETEANPGDIASRAWAFGDGGTSTAANPSHTYAASGTYTVTLTVTYTDGRVVVASATIVAGTTPSGVSSTGTSSAIQPLSKKTIFHTIAGTYTSSSPSDGGFADKAYFLGDPDMEESRTVIRFAVPTGATVVWLDVDVAQDGAIVISPTELALHGPIVPNTQHFEWEIRRTPPNGTGLLSTQFDPPFQQLLYAGGADGFVIDVTGSTAADRDLSQFTVGPIDVAGQTDLWLLFVNTSPEGGYATASVPQWLTATAPFTSDLNQVSRIRLPTNIKMLNLIEGVDGPCIDGGVVTGDAEDRAILRGRGN